MNYTGFVADRKEYNTNNDMVLLLIPEQLDSNLEKLNSYYAVGEMTNVKSMFGIGGKKGCSFFGNML